MRLTYRLHIGQNYQSMTQKCPLIESEPPLPALTFACLEENSSKRKKIVLLKTVKTQLKNKLIGPNLCKIVSARPLQFIQSQIMVYCLVFGF